MRAFRALLALSVLFASPLAAQMSFTNPGAAASGGASGTVTSVAVTTANGVSGTVANPTTTPAISVSLGAITPSSVTASGTVTGSNLSGSNTGDQTITLTSDVTGTGVGSFATTIGANKVTYSKFQQVTASKLLGNPTGSTANAAEISLGPSFTFSGSTLYGASNHPGYIAGNWYSTIADVTFVIGAAPGSGSIRLLPFMLSKSISISDLGARVTGASASGNFQLAIYANNATTGRPTGTALCTTGSLSTTSTGTVSGAATCTGTLTPGLYWQAINQDNGTATYQTINGAVTHMGYLIGSTTLATVSSGSAGASLGLFVTQTFGTWPDLTSASFSEGANTNNALIFMKAQ